MRVTQQDTLNVQKLIASFVISINNGALMRIECIIRRPKNDIDQPIKMKKKQTQKLEVISRRGHFKNNFTWQCE